MITPYYSKGLIVQEQNKILKKYFKKNLLLDFLVFFGFFISYHFNNAWIKYVIFLKIKRMKNIFTNMQERINLRYKFSYLIDLLILVYYVLIIAHICACHFYLVGELQYHDPDQQTWIQVQKLGILIQIIKKKKINKKTIKIWRINIQALYIGQLQQ
ncbi:hypothetical protein IMG5_201510 [Ichthyophthirius multifiliis]|uniref:Transmembrane protein n=1 Tax=Ichthyophthirius multifiliis TaxID=5932 RepID=G0R602_ICHMU|nr:hypothetical protein IMG5_201510 [Ichthyophthirius multifiliis]EGR27126.1 hypothetical protein IMG5_201510 [Ichthyophthirius multifiliis]|eukprot:XP_004024010.1 hypothetical protein IMG5_201510 [Ichthyophthirius multifiliis]